jgi:DNA end-binding protein Ku
MAPRCTGKAVIWFGQVSIPVRLYPATRDPPKIEFRLLHKDCGSRPKQRYLCPADNTLLEEDAIVKGYEVGKDRFVVFTPEDLEAVEPKPDPAIEVAELVDAAEIDPLHWARPHYLGPDVESGPVRLPEADEAARRYAWLADVLRLGGKIALCRWATRGRDLFVGLRAADGRLVLQELRRAEEVRPVGEIELSPVAANEPALQLGLRLAEERSVAEFRPGAYPDERYAATVMAIAAKVRGGEIVAAPVNGRPVIVDLLAALKASVAASPPKKPESPPKPEPLPKKKPRATR